MTKALLFLSLLMSSFAQAEAPCEAELKAALCVTSAPKAEIAYAWEKVSCQPDSERFLPAALELYREIPAPVRPLYCSLKRIFLSDALESVAFATVTMKDGVINGAYVAIRKESFSEALTASELLTWKERLTFGGSKTYLADSPDLVRLSYGFRLENPRMDALLYVILHELGHVVDFRHKISEPGGRWHSLSWASSLMPLPEAHFLGQENICYYRCQKIIPATDAFALYASLKRSAFITSYSGLSPREDFAEFWAWYLLREYKSADYRIQIPGHGELDMNSVFTQNARVRAKMEFMREILQSPEITLNY
jgi:hypothetical protein